MIRLDAVGLSKAYGGVTVLSGVDLCVGAGEVRALVGENGAGKSTLIKILSGAVGPDTGRVRLDGDLLPPGDPLAARVRGLSIVYQEFTLVPELSISENIFLGRESGRLLLQRVAMHRRAQHLLDELGVAVDAGAPVAGLSVAHQQMVEIARSLVTDAKVLILDEPTATLSGVEVETLFGVLRRLRSRGLALLYVSHRLDEIFALADSVTVLRDGRHVATAPIAQFTRESLIRQMVGRDMSEEFPVRHPKVGAPLLEVEHLSAPPRFEDLSLDVREGEIVGLAGLVGAGRTSAALAIVGGLPSSGRRRLLGQSVGFASPAEAIAQGLVYVTEDRKALGIFAAMGLDDNITMTHLTLFTRLGLLSPARQRRAAADAATDFDIRSAGPAQLAGTLSGGNQQKALLARCVLRRPKVLILDEPTRGVDVGARAEIYRIMNRLTAHGLGILMISSDLPEVIGMSDRVVVMRAGRTTGQLARAELTPERVMALAAAG